SWVDAPRALVEVLVLSPLSVDPGCQRRGIGSALVRHALREAEHAGAVAVFLEGDPAYYSRLGFRPGGELGFTRPSVRIPEAAFQVVVLPAHQEWMTGALVYADPFWSLDCVGLRDPSAPRASARLASRA
ncbi:MAG TPA: N-acetyltransferase, partial [Candidatus Lustribacter sp.]|nr:N-acetyltransferase [Candidatus Lustribacter sp.]